MKDIHRKRGDVNNSKFTSMRGLIFLLVFGQVVFAQVPLSVMSYNIRYDNPEDGIHSWTNREMHVSELLDFYRADIIGLQEALAHQYNDLQEVLTHYNSYGLGREDGLMDGEFCPIFWKRSRFDLEEKGTLWLNASGEIGKKGWDAATTRIASWVILYDLDREKQVVVINTHFDHKGRKARLESAKKINALIASQSWKDVIVMGDLNCNPYSEPVSELKKTLQRANDLSAYIPYGKTFTYGGFEVNNPPGEEIDHVFISDGFRVTKMRTIGDSRDGAYPSDHLPVHVYLTW